MARQSKSEKTLAQLQEQQAAVVAEVDRLEQLLANVDEVDIDKATQALVDASARLEGARMAHKNLGAKIRVAQADVDAEKRQAAMKEFDAEKDAERAAVQSAYESIQNAVAALHTAAQADQRAIAQRRIVHPDRTSLPMVTWQTSANDAVQLSNKLEMWLSAN